MLKLISEGTIEETFKVFCEVPELDAYLSLSEMINHLGETYLALVCEIYGELVGFKLGYKKAEGVFYSWLGGVKPNYRKQGIAEKLLIRQEEWAKANGYKKIEVKSMNRYPAMLRLLIRHGYEIYNVTDAGDEEKERIHFRKVLNREYIINVTTKP